MVKWAIAFSALWVGLTIVEQTGAKDFASTLAITLAVSTLIVKGPDALSKLNEIVK